MKKETGFTRITRDVLDLCELQMQLLAVDSQEAQRKVVRAAVLTAIAITLAGSALTTAMVGTGFLVHELSGLSAGTSLLIMAGTIVFIGMVLFVVAIKAVQAAGTAMEETTSEFAENLRWMKAVFISPETSARNQIRAETVPDVEAEITASSTRSARWENECSVNPLETWHPT